MRSCANLIGPNVIKFRHLRDWTQEQLVSKLQLAGLYITRDILANIELRRVVRFSKQEFSAVFKTGHFSL
jgi:hypothetical protein